MPVQQSVTLSQSQSVLTVLTAGWLVTACWTALPHSNRFTQYLVAGGRAVWTEECILECVLRTCFIHLIPWQQHLQQLSNTNTHHWNIIGQSTRPVIYRSCRLQHPVIYRVYQCHLQGLSYTESVTYKACHQQGLSTGSISIMCRICHLQGPVIGVTLRCVMAKGCLF